MYKKLEIGVDEYFEKVFLLGGGKERQDYFDRFRSLSNIVIYGTGVWGKRLLHLFQYNHIDVECFLVADKNNSSDNVEGYPVREINELKGVEWKLSVVFMVEEGMQVNINDYLREQGFENIIPLDIQELWLLDLMVREYNPLGEKECPICKNKLNVFLPAGEHMRFNVICPYCGSRERHRAYYLYWKKSNLFNGEKMKILHFAPERAFYDKISKIPFVDYYPVDINPMVYGVKEKVDITDILYENDMFDVIICNHVLEHIPDEQKALAELKRVLKKGGKAFLNVPVFFKYKTTLEKAEYNTPEMRLKYYGQRDHVRAYGLDYEEHLKRVGFEVKMILINKNYSSEELDRFGLQSNEYIYECSKV